LLLFFSSVLLYFLRHSQLSLPALHPLAARAAKNLKFLVFVLLLSATEEVAARAAKSVVFPSLALEVLKAEVVNQARYLAKLLSPESLVNLETQPD
jgi:hypothetical protein